MADNHAPGTETEAEEPTETRTIQQLIDAGDVGHVRGSDGGAIIDVDPPRSPEEAATRKWQVSRPLTNDG